MICKLCALLTTLVVIFLAAVAFIPDTTNILGVDLSLENKGVDKLPESFSGPLLANEHLNHAEHLFKNEIHGPEAFATFNGKIYTGLFGGRIVEVLPDGYRTVALLDPKKVGAAECAKAYTGQCGRALGLRFDSRGTLYAVDPFNGVFAINVDTGDIKLVVDTKKINAKFLDDLVLIEKPNGHIIFYLTDVSTKWDLFQAMLCVAEYDRTGRLLSYDTETQKVTVEYENLAFPNGLELTDDRSALILCSINDRLLYKFYISGEQAGKLVTLVDNLPGEPDNVKRSADKRHETYWVALYTARNKHRPHFNFDVFGRYGYLKRFVIRLQILVGMAVESVAKLAKCDCLLELGVAIKSGAIPNFGRCEYGMAVEIDANGKIINSLHSPDGKTCALSEVFELEPADGQRRFLLGSATNAYLGRLSVPASAFRSPVSETPKVTLKTAESQEKSATAKPVQAKPAEAKSAESKASQAKTTPPKAATTTGKVEKKKAEGAKRDEL